MISIVDVATSSYWKKMDEMIKLIINILNTDCWYLSPNWLNPTKFFKPVNLGWIPSSQFNALFAGRVVAVSYTHLDVYKRQL